jgi:leader peptidase (prepilin peptidase)/N-methyltransferase
LQLPDWFVPLFVMLFGLLFGSFANVVIWRLPRGESLSTPGSHCPVCDTPIAWYDNIPVVSWVVLRARCRACGTHISARYPGVELLSGGLWLLAWLLYGSSVRLPFAIVFFYLLMILAFIDFDTMRLPNVLVATMAAAGVAGVVWASVAGVAAVPLVDSGGATPALFAAAGVLLGAGVPLAISWAYRALRGRPGMGMGDVKLLAAIGVFLGPYVLLALFFGSVLGALVAVIQRSDRDQKIPFGPFLVAGAVFTAAAGVPLVEAYLSVL